MRKGQIPGQVNLLTEKTENDLIVYVSSVETFDADGRDAVTMTSKEEVSRYVTFVLKRWNGKRPVLRESSGWLTPGERKQARKVVYDIFVKGCREGRFT